jgi:hypothetical protein
MMLRLLLQRVSRAEQDEIESKNSWSIEVVLGRMRTSGILKRKLPSSPV